MYKTELGFKRLHSFLLKMRRKYNRFMAKTAKNLETSSVDFVGSKLIESISFSATDGTGGLTGIYNVKRVKTAETDETLKQGDYIIEITVVTTGNLVGDGLSVEWFYVPDETVRHVFYVNGRPLITADVFNKVYALIGKSTHFDAKVVNTFIGKMFDLNTLISTVNLLRRT